MDYRKYRFRFFEWIAVLGEGILSLGLIGYIFYHSLAGSAALLLLLPFYINRKREKKAQKRRWELSVAFKDGINGVSSALSAGYSLENSFREALRDLELIYPEETDIIIEFRRLVTGFEHHITPEEGLWNLAERSDVEEIRSFSQVVAAGKRTGGNLVRIIAGTSKTIEEKVELKREFQLMIASKRLESRVMSAVPILIILYMWICSPGFLDPLYHSVFGAAVMTGALVLYGTAFWISEKIMDIRF